MSMEQFEKYVGQVFDRRYKISKIIGIGGMAVVFEAHDMLMNRTVAVKMLKEEINNDAQSVKRFINESRAVAMLNHPNIVNIYDVSVKDDIKYIVMEYIHGITLKNYMNRKGVIGWKEALSYMEQILRALEHAHAKGIIHRDVTPDNIYVTKDRTVKLLDFGAARHSLGNVSQSLDVILKHGFAPKEQYSRRGKQGPYTDVYAASASIYYALTGAKPDDAIDRSTEDTMPPPTILGAKISQSLEDALMKGLAVEAADRYQTVAELRNALTVMPVIINPPKPDDSIDLKPKPVFVWTKKKKIIAASVCATLLLLAKSFLSIISTEAS